MTSLRDKVVLAAVALATLVLQLLVLLVVGTAATADADGATTTGTVVLAATLTFVGVPLLAGIGAWLVRRPWPAAAAAVVGYAALGVLGHLSTLLDLAAESYLWLALVALAAVLGAHLGAWVRRSGRRRRPS